jgi:hypothetical protein
LLEFFFVLGALPGSAGCFKKATETETPKAGHPILYNKSMQFHTISRDFYRN